jgi:Na+/H+-dicarboxylate symporter
MSDADRRRERLLTGLILGGMVAGAGLGLGARAVAPLGALVDALQFAGVLFKQLLMLIIQPLVLASIFMGIVGLGDIRRSGRLATRTFVYFAVTTGIAVAVGLVAVNLIRPGDGFDLQSATLVKKDIAQSSLGAFFMDMLKNTFKNPFESLAKGDVLGVIAFALLLGGATTTLPAATARPLIGLMEALNEAMMKLTGAVMWLAPLGVLALVADVVRSQGADALRSLLEYSLTVLVGLGVHGLLVLPLIGWVLGGWAPLRLMRALEKPIAVSFSTASSSATLPVTLETLERDLGLAPRVVRFVVPLGATVNMNGTALYEAVAAMFIAQAYGIDLPLGSQIVVFFTATVAAVGAAGIPGAGLVTMGIVLTAVGLPLDAVGLILAVDRVLDMVRTAINVAGDCVGAVVVHRLSPELHGEPAPAAPEAPG